MLMITIKFLSAFAVLALSMHIVSAHPVVVSLHPRLHPPTPSALTSQEPLAAVNASFTSTKYHRHTMQDLYEGNKKFRQNSRLEAIKAINDTAPAFMFLGCLDNRLTPSDIFHTPSGSIISHDNLANQYSAKDSSADAAVSYAIESLHIQHIIVLGHYGCKSVETAIVKSKSVSWRVRDWVKSVSDLYRRSRRQEIVLLRESRMPRRGQDKGVTAAPAASDPGFRALVEENVKRSVKELRKHSILTEAYSRQYRGHSHLPTEVFVHGFVYDEDTGKVHDLNVSFGPPGKAIPHVPFEALQAAQNYHADNKPDKAWDFGKGH